MLINFTVLFTFDERFLFLTLEITKKWPKGLIWAEKDSSYYKKGPNARLLESNRNTIYVITLYINQYSMSLQKWDEQSTQVFLF